MDINSVMIDPTDDGVLEDLAPSCEAGQAVAQNNVDWVWLGVRLGKYTYS